MGNEFSNKKEPYSHLYKKLKLEKSTAERKPISLIQYGTPKIQFPFQSRTPGGGLESPQVQIQSIEQLSSEKKQDPVIRADLFGKYNEPKVNNRNSDYRNSNTYSGKESSQPLTFQLRTQSNMGNTNDSLRKDAQATRKNHMSWTGQYGDFLAQIDRMKRELESLGEENLELANLITGS